MSFNVNAGCKDLCPEECEKVNFEFSRSSIVPFFLFLNFVVLSISTVSHFHLKLYPSPSFHYSKWKKDPRVIELFRQAKISQDEITYEQLRSSIVGFTFYYESMDVIYIQSEQARLFLDFVSGVGGFWGLFLGKQYTFFVTITLCWSLN
jgi:hypothetical protein